VLDQQRKVLIYGVRRETSVTDSTRLDTEGFGDRIRLSFVWTALMIRSGLKGMGSCIPHLIPAKISGRAEKTS